MRRTLAGELGSEIGQEVELRGWLHAVRRMGGVTFLLLRDRTGMAQAVLNDTGPLDGCYPETVLRVWGTVVEEPRARSGVELRDVDVEVLTPVREPLPFELNKGPLKANLDTYLDHAPVGLRHPKKQATFRIASAILRAYADWMHEHGYTQISTPKIVGLSSEGGANLFEIEYFQQRAYLAQSPQLYKQIMVGVFERVFEIGHAYRAERHYTTRHLNEYVSLDMEMGFIRDHTELMDVLVRVLRHIFEHLRREHEADLAVAGAVVPTIAEVPVVDFLEAQRLLSERYGEEMNEEDLSPSQERALCRWAEGQGSELVFVTGYPTGKTPFYTMRDPLRPERTLSFDLLFRGAELVTGGQRIHEYGQLLDAIERRGYRPEGFGPYLEAFRFGMPPEGGFAIGAERLLARLVGAENVRETALFPRDVTRLTP